MTPIKNNTATSPPLFAVVLGWFLPGLGHISLGQKRRGFLIMFGIFFLVLCGVLVGGIDAVDHTNDGLWFIAQVWCGPVVIGVDMLTQFFIVPLPISERATLVGLSHANEIGTLFIAMAGLMNFVAMLDVLKGTERSDLERRTPQGSRGQSSC
jgi:TM2 domain-containing membrane protein YozV